MDEIKHQDVKNAVAKATDHLNVWAASRLYGSRAEKAYWAQLIIDTPDRILEQLHDAGFAIVRMAKEFDAELDIGKLDPFATEIRLRVKMSPIPVGASHNLSDYLLQDPEFRRQEVPRHLARVILSVYEHELGERIARLLEAEWAKRKEKIDD